MAGVEGMEGVGGSGGGGGGGGGGRGRGDGGGGGGGVEEVVGWRVGSEGWRMNPASCIKKCVLSEQYSVCTEHSS